VVGGLQGDGAEKQGNPERSAPQYAIRGVESGVMSACPSSLFPAPLFLLLALAHTAGQGFLTPLRFLFSLICPATTRLLNSLLCRAFVAAQPRIAERNKPPHLQQPLLTRNRGDNRLVANFTLIRHGFRRKSTGEQKREPLQPTALDSALLSTVVTPAIPASNA
jgi:hypothetical protein